MDPIIPGPTSASAPSAPTSASTSRSTASPAPPLAPLRLRHSLAARITALVALVLVATALASLLIVRQLRDLQASFDLLTIVYVEFNRDLTVAYRQSVRVATHIEFMRERMSEAQRLLSPSAEANLAETTLSDHDLACSAFERVLRIHRDHRGAVEALTRLYRALGSWHGLAASLGNLQDMVDSDEEALTIAS